ncbi:MAG: hypothetical protein L0H53_12360 [Candidatus Nitrosocosmicus sp.]|nr:hypothetical protein [Candidatus Nitrosocosmicus sp.]MDN5868554.1 hypothetical protein [Candidatus Nitrosocosmicus sp.]
MFPKQNLKFEEFKIGQTFKSHICIDKNDFKKYLSFAKTKNILHENPELALNEWIKSDTLLPGRAIIARAEGEMTRLDIFSNSIMLLYGMDGDPTWSNRNTRFIGEVNAGEELEVEYIISDKNGEKNREKYGILSIDFRIKRLRDNKIVIISRRNSYRIKK